MIIAVFTPTPLTTIYTDDQVLSFPLELRLIAVPGVRTCNAHGRVSPTVKAKTVRWRTTHSSGAVWESRWPSWAVRPNEPHGFRGRKAILNHAHALVVPNMSTDIRGEQESSGAVWKSGWTSWAPVPNKPMVSVEVKPHFKQGHIFG